MKNNVEEITTSAQLKSLLEEIDADLKSGDTTPVHVVGLMNNLINRQNSTKLFDSKNKTIASSIWDQIKNSGMQVNEPPLIKNKSTKTATV